MPRRTFRKKSNKSKRKRTLRKKQKVGGNPPSDAFFNHENFKIANLRTGMNKASSTEKNLGVSLGSDHLHEDAKLLTGINAIQWGKGERENLFLIKNAQMDGEKVELSGFRFTAKKATGLGTRLKRGITSTVGLRETSYGVLMTDGTTISGNNKLVIKQTPDDKVGSVGNDIYTTLKSLVQSEEGPLVQSIPSSKILGAVPKAGSSDMTSDTVE